MRRAVLVLLLVLALPASAHATASIDTRTSASVRNLALLGDGRPVWAEKARDGSITALTIVGDSSRTLARDRPRHSGEDLTASVLAGGDHAAVAFSRYECDDCHQTPSLNGTSVFAGPVTAPLPKRGDVQQPEWTLQLGDGLVGLPPLLADLGTGARRDFAAAAAGFLRLGGGLMARREPGQGPVFVVSEVATGRELYRLPTDRTDALALAADGTLLLGHLGGPLSIATPTDPTPRPLPIDATNAYPFLVPGRIGLWRGRAFTVHDLTGARLTTVDLGDPDTPVAYDGARLAWVTERCGVSFVRVWDLGGPAPQVPSGLCTTSSVRIGRLTDDGLDVTLSCARSSPLGCRPALAGEIRRLRRGGRRGGWIDLEAAIEPVAPGERVRVRLTTPYAIIPGTYEVRVTRDERRLRLRRARVR